VVGVSDLVPHLDDWVSHALGWPTPLDTAWHVLHRWQVLVLLTGLAAVVWVVLGASRYYRSS